MINKPFIIAEIGVNHECDIALAKRMIDEVKESGGHAVKFQTYKASKIASKHAKAYWDLESEPTLNQKELLKNMIVLVNESIVNCTAIQRKGASSLCLLLLISRAWIS